MLEKLFVTTGEEEKRSTRQLDGTAELTRVSEKAVSEVMLAVEERIEELGGMLREATTGEVKAVDALLDATIDLKEVDVDFLRELSEGTLVSMLKSQQSKRSRSKSKQMTLDNFRAMLAADIAEKLLRSVLGKPKSERFGSRKFGGEYTIEDLEYLAANQDMLRKEIRNVQSKKSIAKKKEDFDEASESWQQLLKIEQQLKDLRVEWSAPKDHTKEQLQEMLNEIDIEHLKSADSKELLKAIQELVAGGSNA